MKHETCGNEDMSIFLSSGRSDYESIVRNGRSREKTFLGHFILPVDHPKPSHEHNAATHLSSLNTAMQVLLQGRKWYNQEIQECTQPENWVVTSHAATHSSCRHHPHLNKNSSSNRRQRGQRRRLNTPVVDSGSSPNRVTPNLAKPWLSYVRENYVNPISVATTS